MANSFVNSLKTAGASGLEAAKDFSSRVKAEHAQQPKPEGSFLDKVTGTARGLGKSVSNAAGEVRDSEAFARARKDFNAAYEEGREGVESAISSVKEKRSGSTSANGNIIDGEVIAEGEENPFGPAR
ncbi:hypothetical protein WM42_1099 [Corynebacterium simulans]|mgnify:FL=1|uniref:Uncharacterized protein n=1 Tax=Corynebacterium accolens TaxID=38284 RepID=A0A2A4AMZ9_9CORY|nr:MULTISPECIES: hypothetical protein [Corynebacterium]AMO88837.1 hypothetical protein WM42_1099 [Corynebacterium simulans]OFT48757.1 hypothetical protein HMPREF3158_01150 [Corynebacterium sp. HMSC06G04]OHO67356.1 hypothetical protein HMPREF2692_06535 [Corynebacterium sp. HMSC036D03]PCC83872.1 hypothetical protein COM45_00105 [Corynebacterium accolens]